MPFLVAVLGAFAALGYWYFRARNVATLIDMAEDVRLAARRLSFTRRANTHPIDAIEDPRPLAAGVAAAIADMGGPLSERQIAGLHREAAIAFGTGAAETADIVTLGRWLAGQCGTPDEAARRLTRRARERAGAAGGPDLLRMISATLEPGRVPTDRQEEALRRVRRAFAAEPRES